MPKTKGARNFKRSVLAAYDKEGNCVCVGFIEDICDFLELEHNKRSENIIYCALHKGGKALGKYYIYKVDTEITGSGRRKKI